MPAIGRSGSSEPAHPHPPPQEGRKDEMRARLDLKKPLTADAHQLPQAAGIDGAPPEPWRLESEYKPFFTQVGTAIPNRQHNRLVMVVPLLLLVIILLFVFAYIASK
jgi:hypothetical protein